MFYDLILVVVIQLYTITKDMKIFSKDVIVCLTHINKAGEKIDNIQEET